MFVVRTLADLDLAPRHQRINGFVERLAIRLDLPGIALSRQLYWQRKLDALQRRCGCAAAAAVMLLGLVVVAVYIYYRYPALNPVAVLMHITLGFLLVVVLAMIAKTFTLKITQFEFRWVCHRIRADLNSMT